MDEPVTPQASATCTAGPTGPKHCLRIDPHLHPAFRRNNYREMGDRPLAHLPVDPADPCRASACWCGRGVASRGADPQSDGESVGRAYESCHLTRHVALRCFSRSRRSAVQYRPVARLSTWRAGRQCSVGPSGRGAAGCVRRAPAGTAVVDCGTIHSRDPVYGGHRVDRRHVSREGPPSAVGTLGRRHPDRNGHRSPRHVYRWQREPGPPVRTGGDVWTDALPVGISTRTDAGSRDRGVAPTDYPAPSQRADAPIMRYSRGRKPAVRSPDLPRNALFSTTHERSITIWGGREVPLIRGEMENAALTETPLRNCEQSDLEVHSFTGSSTIKSVRR